MDAFYVSAPGKVILYGEHSAVYGKPAIAAALSLRAYLMVAPSDDEDTIRLDFPDIELSQSWNRKHIPFEEVNKYISRKDGVPQTTEELVPEIVDKLSVCLSKVEDPRHYTTCLSFLYIYVHMCSETTRGLHFCVRSTVPIGAGLGSSASVSVCLVSALALLGGQINKPTFGLNDKVDVSDVAELDFIDSWSFMGEKAFHGNPSGIDNAVATHGGAVMYQRMTNPSQPSIRTTMRNFPPVRLLLTNTKVPRSTATLVGDVSQRNNTHPAIYGHILDAMGSISHSAYQVMIRPTFDEESHKKLKELVEINHGLLVSLGVSHPYLEEIKIQTSNIGATKLTGAGGGGCAITLVDDDVKHEEIQKIISEFHNKGFECYETSLGGKGVGAIFNQAPSLKEFRSFSDRTQIEDALHIDKVDAWKFW